MKKFKEMLEQHREKGRFHPVKPYNVSNTAAASPRPSSDSASVKLKEDLRKWFSKTDPAGDWKRINSKGEAIGPCAREPGEPKPKCMSKAKRAALSKKERAAAVRAKRKHDPNPERKGEPINVSNFGKGKISENMENLDEKNVPTSPEKWARAKAMAKSKFDVYPSAYANGWASKKYKEMGGGWKSVSEENTLLEKWSQKYKSSIDCDNPKGFSQKAHCAGKEKNEEVVHEGAVPAKEKTVMVRHKTSGKELVVTQQKAKELQKHDYHPVKEEIEQIDELSNDTLKSYLKNKKEVEGGGVGRQGSGYSYEKSEDGTRSAIRRIQARKNQIGKYGEVPKVPGYNKEEVEQIEEVVITSGPVSNAKKHGWEYDQETYGATYKHSKHGHIDINRYGEWQHRPKSGIFRGKGDLIARGNDMQSLHKHIASLKEEIEQTNEAVKDKFDIGEYDQEGDMAKSDLRSIMANAKRVHDMLEDSDNLPEWVQSKITLAEDYMSTVANYMTSEMSESNDDIGLVKPKTNLTAAAKTLAPATRVAEESSWSKSGKEATHRETGKKTYEYKEYDKEGKETGRREYRDEKGKSMGEAVVPFDKPYTTTKGVVTDKSGAKHGPMSRARDIARMAMKKQVEKMKQPVKESLEESRRMEIVREAMKDAKKKKETTVPDDKYQSDPILSSQITKT